MAGKANKLIFKDSEKARDSITDAQKKEIARLYEEWAKDLGEQAKYYRKRDTESSALLARQAKALQKSLTEQSKVVSNEVYKMIKQNIYLVSDSVVKDNISWLYSLGFNEKDLSMAFTSIPDDIVRMLVTGQIYESGWSLSSRIWGSNERTLKNCYEIVAKGVAENRPIYDIAKELEKYVSPQTAKSWNPILKMKNTKTGEWEYQRIYRGKVDYNAQRLARTLVQHGYQQSFIAATEKNPFVLKYQWLANGSRVCPICEARNGQLYNKDELPLDHPNGMCTMVPVIEDNIVDRLADWFNSPDGTYPEIDEFAKNFGYTPQQQNQKEKDISILGSSKAKTFNSWYQKLDDEKKAIAKDAKVKSGLTWQKWYEQNIYAGEKIPASKAAKDAMADNKANTTAGTAYDKWIGLMKKQTESSMLNTEASQFAKMTDAQVNGIKTYTGSSYTEMNTYLRMVASGMSSTEAKDLSGIAGYQLRALENAREGLSNAALTKDIYLRRGTDLGDLAGLLPGNFRENKNTVDSMGFDEIKERFIGMQGVYAGFTSTSSLYGRGFGGPVEIIFHAPEGTEATSVMTISNYGTAEGETLLNAGTRVEITAIERSDGHMDSVIRVFMEIIKK